MWQASSPPWLPLPQDANAFSCVVITDTGKMYGQFLGLVTSRDIDFENDLNRPLGEVMTK